MACERLTIPGHDGVMIVCGERGRKHFCHCGRPAELLCDWKVSAKKSGTCDRPLCKIHAQEVAPEKHLCPEHQKAWAAWKRAKYAQGIDPVPHGSPKQENLFPGPL